MAKIEKIGNIQVIDNKEDKFFYFPMISMACTGAEYITGADSSCLMHMEGVIKREKLPIKTIHIVQILASGL